MSKVMLIEDNLLNSRLIVFILKRDGFNITSYDNAEDAISDAETDAPDIILMDIQLPGMDGLTATRRLKENPVTADIPVVAITAHAMSGDRERILAAGCAGYISKPVDTRELANALREFLPERSGPEP